MNEPQNLRTSEPHGNSNVDLDVVKHFGNEWRSFDNEGRPQEDLKREFEGYFSIFPWDKLPDNAVGFDAGCGSGRWAKFVLQNKKVGLLNCIDPSDALEIAKNKLSNFKNVCFFRSSIDNMPIEDNSHDFGYCLGVLHHIPDTLRAMQKCTDKLKPGAPFLIYMYYNFENRPLCFKWIWKCSDVLRHVICRLPHSIKILITNVIATCIYYPLAKIAYLAKKLHLPYKNIPLSAYRCASFYDMRNGALDRFGTCLEKRCSKAEIVDLMQKSHLENISFSDNPDVNWCAVGYKKA